MTASVLVPHPGGLHEIRTVRRPGPPAFSLRGLPEDRARPVADRIRAAIVNSGYTVPSGHLEVDAPTPGDLAIALGVLLADPAHEHLRQPGLVAWGGLHLDGRVRPGPAPGVADLPAGAWLARFWHPADRIPAPEEHAVLTLVDVESLPEAWRVLVGFLDIQQRLHELVTT